MPDLEHAADSSSSGAATTNRQRWFSRCFFAMLPSFQLAVIANHLYSVISLGYLLLNGARVLSFEPSSEVVTAAPAADAVVEAPSSDIGAHGDHWRLLLVSDIIMLALAALFVVDAGLFALLHARTIPIEQLTGAATPAVTTRESAPKQQSQQQLSQPSPTRRIITPIRVRTADASMQDQSVELHSLLSRDGIDHSSLRVSATPSPPPLASATGAASVASSPSSSSSSPSSPSSSSSQPRFRSLLRFFFSLSFFSPRLFRLLFLSSLSGLAELLNLLGGLGYLWTALIPFAYFLVSEEWERTMDRTANLIETAAMGAFLIDSGVYFILWKRRKIEEEEEEAAAAATRQNALNDARGTEQDNEENDLPELAEDGSGELLLSRPINIRSSSSGSGASAAVPVTSVSPLSFRSLFSPRSPHRDAAFWAVVCNMLASCFYLASTLYGFWIRLKIGKEMDQITTTTIAAAAMEQQQAAAEVAARGPAAGTIVRNGVLYRSAQLLFSSRQDYSSPIPYSTLQAARSGGMLGSVGGGVGMAAAAAAAAFSPSWEREMESALHEQQVVALAGDALYFLCAVWMEMAHYRESAAAEAKASGKGPNRRQGQVQQQRNLSNSSPSSSSSNSSKRGIIRVSSLAALSRTSSPPVASVHQRRDDDEEEELLSELPSDFGRQLQQLEGELESIASTHEIDPVDDANAAAAGVSSPLFSTSTAASASGNVTPVALSIASSATWHHRHGHAYAATTPGAPAHDTDSGAIF